MYISKLFLYVSGHLVNLEAAKEFELDLTRDISNLGENLSCLRSFEGRFPNSQPTATIEFFCSALKRILKYFLLLRHFHVSLKL